MEEAKLEEDFSLHVLDYLKTVLGADALLSVEMEDMKSAQQRVLLLSNIQNPLLSSVPLSWQKALQLGNGCLIARQWKASACWWNLNRNQTDEANGSASTSLATMARSEIAGYSISRKALPKIHMPEVLYFSHARNNSTTDRKPWAILAYVGEHSKLYHNNNKWVLDESWEKGMVKTRLEFGFIEPHPRWGRVSEKQCLDYALTVLRQVIIPLHQYIRAFPTDEIDEIKDLRQPASQATTVGFTYKYMVDMYQQEHQIMKQTLALSNDTKLKAAIEILGKAIENLAQQQPYLNEQPNSHHFVLVHMDCQPQNLLFASTTDVETCFDRDPRISSVFDWEEAAWADFRFELLLLCRKVCANRDQAEQIWKIYKRECPQLELGSLAPWLAMETVHSITSLLLQSMDLLGGGRNPWESKPDLWGKVQREIRRLFLEHGWNFCDAPEFR